MNTFQINQNVSKLTKNYNFEKKKIYEILSKVTPEVMEIAFNDARVFNNVLNIDDYELIFMIFRMVPASIQEKIWLYPKFQKKLLALSNYPDDVLIDKLCNGDFFSETTLPKKDQRGEFYLSKEKFKSVQMFLNSIKSIQILNDLPKNKYFQIVILGTKKLPGDVLKRINIEHLFKETMASDIYPNVNIKYKRYWCSSLNNLSEKLLLPYDVNSLYSETKTLSSLYENNKNMTLGKMLKSKLFVLSSKNKKLVLTIEDLKKLNIAEISILLEDDYGTVDQELLNTYLCELLAKVIKDGSIVSPQYLPMNNFNDAYSFKVFKIACYKLIGGPFEKKLLDYVYANLFENEYSEEIKAQIYASLKSVLIYIDKQQANKLFSMPNDMKSIFYLRFNICALNMDYLHGLSVLQMVNLNVKHINRIVKLIDDQTNDELSDIYSKAIKMYFVFGLDKTIKILNGDYGMVQKSFMDNVSKLDISNVAMKLEGNRYIPVPNKDFFHFLFSNSQNITRILSGNSALRSSWYYLYNNIDMILKICKGHINALKAEIILTEQINNVKYDLTPDNYRLRSILYEVGLGNKTKNNNETIYDELVKTYEKQVTRVTSSIPYVSGTLASGYRYETMKLDSLLGYILGYKMNCCIRLLDIAHNHLLHSLLCENGRILIVYSPDESVVSFSPLKRNGELLIANSIETINALGVKEIIEAFTTGIKDIMTKSKSNEGKDYLKVACIGEQSLIKPDGQKWPTNIETPTILEKTDPVYEDTDCYHKKLIIIAKENDVNLRDLKYGKVETKYYDPREKYEVMDFKNADDLCKLEATKAIDAIRYRKYKDSKSDKPFCEMSAYALKYAFYTKDWYVLIDFNNKMAYDALDYDPRAKDEMAAVVMTIEEHLKNDSLKTWLLTLKK